MVELTDSIRSVQIPLADSQIVLPNVALAEIVGYRTPEPIADTPGWLLGTVEWRGHRVPVLCYEVLYDGMPARPGRASRLVVCNTISGCRGLPFLALVSADIPRLIRIDTDTLEADDADSESFPGVLCPVQIYGESAYIPDLDALEAMCLEQLGEIEQPDVAGTAG